MGEKKIMLSHQSSATTPRQVLFCKIKQTTKSKRNKPRMINKTFLFEQAIAKVNNRARSTCAYSRVVTYLDRVASSCWSVPIKKCWPREPERCERVNLHEVLEHNWNERARAIGYANHEDCRASCAIKVSQYSLLRGPMKMQYSPNWNSIGTLTDQWEHSICSNLFQYVYRFAHDRVIPARCRRSSSLRSESLISLMATLCFH